MQMGLVILRKRKKKKHFPLERKPKLFFRWSIGLASNYDAMQVSWYTLLKIWCMVWLTGNFLVILFSWQIVSGSATTTTRTPSTVWPARFEASWSAAAPTRVHSSRREWFRSSGVTSSRRRTRFTTSIVFGIWMSSPREVRQVVAPQQQQESVGRYPGIIYKVISPTIPSWFFSDVLQPIDQDGCNGNLPLGCIYEELLPSSVLQVSIGGVATPRLHPSSCLRSCLATMGNPSLVGVRWAEEEKVTKCFCLGEGLVTTGMLGPSRVCDQKCGLREGKPTQ